MHAAEKARQHELLLSRRVNALTKQQKFDHLRPWRIVQINLNVLVILFASVCKHSELSFGELTDAPMSRAHAT